MLYTTAQTTLQHHNPELCAAETQGLMTGLLCAKPNAEISECLLELLDSDRAYLAEAEQLLTRLFAETRRLLNDADFAFDLLLPDDDAPLPERALALKRWCQGFLYGAGLGQAADAPDGQSRDILKDISEFTQLDSSAEGEADEAAFMEICEYLRSAVFLLNAEWAATPEAHA